MESTHLRQFRLMAQYNAWVNQHIYELARLLSEEERRRDCGAFFGSVQGTLNHLLVGDRAWLGRFATCTIFLKASSAIGDKRQSLNRQGSEVPQNWGI